MIPEIHRALTKRTSLIQSLHRENTNCYRLFHGATEGVSGLSIDRYNDILLFQTWRAPLCSTQVSEITQEISSLLDLPLIPIWNHRKKRGQVSHQLTSTFETDPKGTELGLIYNVNPVHEGIDPLLFLDFRAARRWITQNVQNKTVLNLFSYTCGIGLAACQGEAKHVYNVDFSHRSLQIGIQNAQQNNFQTEGENALFRCIKDDVFAVIRQFSGLGIKGRAAKKSFTKRKPQQFDIVVLDPPRLAKSSFGKVDLVNDYQALFKPALLCTNPNGWILATNNVASVSQEVWHNQLARCAQKARVPIQQWIPIQPEEDFPSPDQNWPLKMILCQIGE